MKGPGSLKETENCQIVSLSDHTKNFKNSAPVSWDHPELDFSREYPIQSDKNFIFLWHQVSKKGKSKFSILHFCRVNRT